MFDQRTPACDPAPNPPKWFAAVGMIRRAADQDRLHKATEGISTYWRHKRQRRRTPPTLVTSIPAPSRQISGGGLI